MKNEPFILRRTYDAPVEKVWKAITDIKLMQQWYMDKLEDFKAEEGFSTSFTVHNEGKDYVHLWKVTEVVPPKKIAYEWRYAGYPGNSLVTFELTAEGKGTTLTLTHSGLETFNPEVYPELGKDRFSAGWNELLSVLLKKFVEK